MNRKKYKLKTFSLICFLVFIIILFNGCSYSVYSNSLPHLKNIVIQSFENKTNEFELEEEIQSDLITRFNDDGRLRTVTLEPDCILEGIIMDYTRKIDTFDETGIEEYQVKILFSIKFTDLLKDEVIWEKDSLILSEVYSEDDDDAEYQTEVEAREAIYEKLFNDVMKNTLEEW